MNDQPIQSTTTPSPTPATESPAEALSHAEAEIAAARAALAAQSAASASAPAVPAGLQPLVTAIEAMKDPAPIFEDRKVRQAIFDESNRLRQLSNQPGYLTVEALLAGLLGTA